MRAILFAIAALALTACNEPPERSAAAACTQTVTHNVTWSQAGAADTITARGEGPTCKQAVVTFVARNSVGDPLWTFASTHYDMTTGGALPDNAPDVSGEELRRFLTSWATVTEMRSNALPEWREDMSRPGEGVRTLGYETPFDREIYQALRARDLPTICYAAAVAAVQCLVIDPASHAPALIVAYGS